MHELTRAGIPCSIYLSPIFPFLSEQLLEDSIAQASKNGAKCCSAIFLKIRPIVWRDVKAFLDENSPALVSEYEELYFKHGDKDLSNYLLSRYAYRRSIMESLAETCKKNNLRFTSEEFFDLWTTPYSDCVDIDCWHAPTAYDIWRLAITKNGKQFDLDEAVQILVKNLDVDERYLKKLREHWNSELLLLDREQEGEAGFRLIS